MHASTRARTHRTIFCVSIVGLVLSLGPRAASASESVTVTSVATSGGTVNGDPGVALTNGVPAEGTAWDSGSTTSAWWSGTSPILTLTFDQPYVLENVLLSVDMNDDYQVQTSLDGSTWTTLFDVDDADGESEWGLDAMSGYSGDAEYVSRIDFEPLSVLARYARIYATGGDGQNAVGELQFQGIPQSSLVTVANVTSSGGTVNGDFAAITNNCPAEETAWNTGGTATVWWNVSGPSLTLAFDQAYRLDDVLLSVDCTDDYRVETSMDGSNWTTLFDIVDADGETYPGMDTMTSYSSDEYVAGIDFRPMAARYARIYATAGDYLCAVGELRFIGVPLAIPITAFGADLDTVNNFLFEADHWGSAMWTLTGDASWADDSGLEVPKRLRLNSATMGASGAAWLNAYRIDPTKHWWIRADVQHSAQVGTGADHLSLVLQTGGTNALSPAGSWGNHIEFSLDSYKNGSEPENSLKVYTNLVLIHTMAIGTTGNWPLEDTRYNNMRVRYYPATKTAARQLIVQFWTDGQSEDTYKWDLGSTIDLDALFGDELVTVGFWGSTGASWENHDVMSAYVLGETELAGSYDGAKMGMKWTHTRGLSYDVEYSPSIMYPDWRLLSVPLVPSGIDGSNPNGSEMATQVPVTNSASFFRVIGK